MGEDEVWPAGKSGPHTLRFVCYVPGRLATNRAARQYRDRVHVRFHGTQSPSRTLTLHPRAAVVQKTEKKKPLYRVQTRIIDRSRYHRPATEQRARARSFEWDTPSAHIGVGEGPCVQHTCNA